jgi:predicted ATPase
MFPVNIEDMPMSRCPIMSGTLGQFERAWNVIDEAMEAIETTKEKWCEAEVNRMAGEVALKSPVIDTAKAEAYFERALAVARAQQAKSWELRAAMSHGAAVA